MKYVHLICHILYQVCDLLHAFHMTIVYTKEDNLSRSLSRYRKVDESD